MTGADGFRAVLADILRNAEEKGQTSVTVTAGDLHKIVHGRGALKNEMPTCCNVMWRAFSKESGDVVISSPPSGKGGRLSLCYTLPRKHGVTGGMPSSVKAERSTILKGTRPAWAPGGEGSLFTNAKSMLRDPSRLREAIAVFQDSKGTSLRKTIAELQGALAGKGDGECNIAFNGISTRMVFNAALLVKAASAQVNEVVHASSIILALPKILEPGEMIEHLSLAAGNSGTPFDVQTNLRVAEFKVIDWKGADSVREAQLFKDFFNLCEATTNKRKYLYVTGLERALAALQSNRSCKKTLKTSLADAFELRYPELHTINDYYIAKRGEVLVVGLDEVLIEFTTINAATTN